MRYGPSLDGVHEYETFLRERDREKPASLAAEVSETGTPARFREIVVCDAAGLPRDQFARGEDVHIRLRIESDVPEQPVHVLVGIHREADDLQCFTVGTHADGLAPLSGRTEYEMTVRLFDLPLLRGEYSIIAYVGDEHAMAVFDRRDVRPAFSMTGDRFEVGMISVDHRWELEPASVEVVAPSR
jgi:hypothetical protein